MSKLNDYISGDDGLVAGDHFDVRYTVSGLPAGKVVVKAWLTAKTHANQTDADAAIQKVITMTDDPTEGVIEDDNTDGAGDAVLLFRLQPADTRAVGGKRAEFDVQLLFNDGDVTTPIAGEMRARDDVTRTAS